MAHPKLLAPLTPDRKLVWDRVELHISIFDAPLECGMSPKQKTRTSSSSEGKNIDVCCIQETHLNSSHRFSIRLLGATRLSEETGKIDQKRNRYPCKEHPRCSRTLQVRRRRHGCPWYQVATWQNSPHNLQSILATQQTAAFPSFSAWPRPMDHHGWLQQPLPKLGLCWSWS